jgi:hypothetical protein
MENGFLGDQGATLNAIDFGFLQRGEGFAMESELFDGGHRETPERGIQKDARKRDQDFVGSSLFRERAGHAGVASRGSAVQRIAGAAAVIAGGVTTEIAGEAASSFVCILLGHGVQCLFGEREFLVNLHETTPKKAHEGGRGEGKRGV